MAAEQDEPQVPSSQRVCPGLQADMTVTHSSGLSAQAPSPQVTREPQGGAAAMHAFGDAAQVPERQKKPPRGRQRSRMTAWHADTELLHEPSMQRNRLAIGHADMHLSSVPAGLHVLSVGHATMPEGHGHVGRQRAE